MLWIEHNCVRYTSIGHKEVTEICQHKDNQSRQSAFKRIVWDFVKRNFVTRIVVSHRPNVIIGGNNPERPRNDRSKDVHYQFSYRKGTYSYKHSKHVRSCYKHRRLYYGIKTQKTLSKLLKKDKILYKLNPRAECKVNWPAFVSFFIHSRVCVFQWFPMSEFVSRWQKYTVLHYKSSFEWNFLMQISVTRQIPAPQTMDNVQSRVSQTWVAALHPVDRDLIWGVTNFWRVI
jgi:hypothetical protein